MDWIHRARNFSKKIFKKDSIKMDSYPNKETFKYFKEKYKEQAEHIHITTSDYSAIIKEYLEFSTDKVIEHRDGFEFTGFGHMIVISRPKTSKKKVYSKFNCFKHNMEIPHLNLHSEGRLCRFIFSSKSKKYRIKNKRMWTFCFNSYQKGKISKAFRKNHNKYLRTYKIGKIANNLMDNNAID